MTEKQKIMSGTGGIKPMDKYIYRAKLDRVVDGDTIDALIDVGFDIWVKKRIRFMGLDTWECRTRNLEEKKLGLAATHSKKLNGESFNIGNGDNYSVNELADMFGGEKQYGNKVIEPFETLAEMAKIDLDLDWKPKSDLKKWIKNYLKNE